MRISSSIKTVLKPTVAALGNFDGLHCGHRQVIQPILTQSVGQTLAHGSERIYSTVVSFSPHPVEFFSGKTVPTLTPGNEKAYQLQQMGVDQLVLLPFDHALARLTPEEFVQEILVQNLQARFVSVGEDFRFGCRRSGTAEDLRAIAATYGIEVVLVALETFQGERISSTAIRKALQTGDLATANRMLGRSYSLVGEVVKGQQLGRTIGFPTANLALPARKLIPHQGVYAVRVSGIVGTSHPVLGVMNIGNRPTVDGVQQTIEVHLLDWSGDLYGQTLTVELLEFIRMEQKFLSLDDLKAQITTDCAIARQRLALCK
ncbi:bifunctional riboflavin kinase/FAD synthetase [Alkalinema sp. FACHB-956]|uniref:bifunctional riboflavin kinase/FAD synthetase n=1 Tax=Alkalinema sp. FACHB-956 TaxID=2692768 RepID=UPI0016833F8D|nr:bifunctional riboflavin kinase/FAD synthetase [Alkalinema sp. FACHB-956]